MDILGSFVITVLGIAIGIGLVLIFLFVLDRMYYDNFFNGDDAIINVVVTVASIFFTAIGILATDWLFNTVLTDFPNHEYATIGWYAITLLGTWITLLKNR